MSKKFINSAQDVVCESLTGLSIVMEQQLDLIYQNKQNKNEIPIVAVKNQYLLDNDNVRLVSGGGSGHEPAHAGYVCNQMLASAVCGQVFASPSLQQIKRTLEYLIQNKKDQSVLVIIKNYTGDIINFESAVDMIKNQYNSKGFNLQIETLQVGDDVALIKQLENTKVKPRGIAGTSLLYKILGAASYQGHSIQQLKQIGQNILDNLYSFGICLDNCTLPGQKQGAVLGDDKMEVGMGIHGEKGREIQQLQQNQQIVKQLLNDLIKTNNVKGKIVVMINNLGNVTALEMGIIVRDVVQIIGSDFQEVSIHRLIQGNVMTSLDMNGYSLTVLGLDILENQEKIVEWIDLKVDSPFWPGSISVGDSSNIIYQEQSQSGLDKQQFSSQECRLKSWVRCLCEDLIKNNEHFTELDKQVGDGDLGVGLKRGCQSVLEILDGLDLQNSVQSSMIRIADEFSDSFGGTSGPLWGVFLSSMASQLQDVEQQNKQQNWIAGFSNGLKAMQRVGGAEKGDRTMVDALIAVDQYISDNQQINMSELSKVVRVASDQAKDLLAQKGRSAYLGDKVKGLAEPGCELVAHIFSKLVEL